MSLTQAKILWNLRQTDVDAYWDKVDELGLRIDEDNMPIVSQAIPQSLQISRSQQHSHIIDIVNNWEDEIELITKNIINPGFETLSKIKLPLYGLDIREDYRIEEDDSGFEKKIYNQSSFLTDAADNLSPRTKAWLSQQRTDQKNYLGWHKLKI